MKKRLFVMSFIFVGSVLFCGVMQSPDSMLKLDIEVKSGKAEFDVKYNGKILFEKNRLGLITDTVQFSRFQSLSEIEIQDSYVSEIWNPVFGADFSVVNDYNQYLFELKTKDKQVLLVRFRVYNDGFGFRYELSEEYKNIFSLIKGELTEFRPAGRAEIWAYNGENDNIGPVSLLGSPFNMKMPVVFNYGDSAAAVMEAGIYQYSQSSLKKNLLRGYKIESGINKVFFPYNSSWRAVKVGKTPGKLIESRLLENLNPPCQIEDTSWIKTGKSMWDWRVNGFETADGFKYGLNTVSHYRLIDFAAENNIEMLLIDADWYGPEFEENSDPTKSGGDVYIKGLFDYAKKKGIGVILYLNDVGAKKYGLENILKTFSDWGASGIKYGFMSGTGQDKVLWTRKVIETCAKYQLTVNFHDGPVAPSGDSRTFPNVIAREFGYAQCDALKVEQPHNLVAALYINMLAGEMDLTYGWYGLNSAFGERVKVFDDIPGTVAAENARLFLINTGIVCLPDAPERYIEKSDLFDFVRELPTKWDETRFVCGEIGKYISLARRSGDKWFAGVLTDETARTVELNTDFLNPGELYNLRVFCDSENSHYKNNKESYLIKSLTVKGGEVLSLNLAPGGGATIIFEKN